MAFGAILNHKTANADFRKRGSNPFKPLTWPGGKNKTNPEQEKTSKRNR
ncbi:MAG: hypothetical protein ABJP02_07550 [Parasphingorhabdus sp.]